MPLYEFQCHAGHRFETLTTLVASSPPCPACGADTKRQVSRFATLGRASAGRPTAQMPQTWRSTHGADRDYVTSLRAEADHRVALEERHPELRGESRPVVAHEGRFEHAPLYQGDAVIRHDHGHDHVHQQLKERN